MVNFLDKVKGRARARSRREDLTDTASRPDRGSTADSGESADPAALLRDTFIP